MSRTPHVDGLSYYRVQELQRFCWQYAEKKCRINARREGFNDFSARSFGGGGAIGKPTEARALDVLYSREQHDIDLIEACANQATGGVKRLRDALLINVTERVPFELAGGVPCGRNQFYKMVDRFYRLLDVAQMRGI